MVKTDICDLIMKEYGKTIELEVRARPLKDPNCP